MEAAGARRQHLYTACPVAGSLPGDVQRKLAEALDTQSVEVELVWDPAWNPSMMTEAAKLQLGML